MSDKRSPSFPRKQMLSDPLASTDTPSQKRSHGAVVDVHNNSDPSTQKKRRLISPPTSQPHEQAINKHDPPSDPNRLLDPHGGAQNPKPPSVVEDLRGNAIKHWAESSVWPVNFAEMNSPVAPSIERSYSQSLKDGSVQRSHSPASENELARHGVVSNLLKGRELIADDQVAFCEELLDEKHHIEPKHTSFPLEKIDAVWEQVRNRNQARVVRDITPILIPSAELLYVIEGHDHLDFLVDEIDTEWTKPMTLGGPRPKPDFFVALSAHVFNIEEIAKMRYYTAIQCPTLFNEFVYFPFLIVEVKCGDQAINRADRQNMHAASIAVKAIISLYQSLGEEMVAPLLGKILAFSISHDIERAKIYGHFAQREGTLIQYYRYQIRDVIFSEPTGRTRREIYGFVRQVYDVFFPAHLKRIKDALKQMDAPPEIPSEVAITNSQSGFKVPGAPASSLVVAENRQLHATIAQLHATITQQTALNAQLQTTIEQLNKRMENYDALLGRLMDREG